VKMIGTSTTYEHFVNYGNFRGENASSIWHNTPVNIHRLRIINAAAKAFYTNGTHLNNRCQIMILQLRGKSYDW